jgi:hypothetical protein
MQSALSTTFGSSRDACHAGSPQANEATSEIVATAETMVVGSVGWHAEQQRREQPREPTR